MIAAKMDALKNLIQQMQMLMADGHGDDKEAGEEAMESLGEGELPSEEKKEEECASGEDDDLRSAVRDAFKPKQKAPAKGAMIVMQEKMEPAKKDFPSRKKGKGGMNYG